MVKFFAAPQSNTLIHKNDSDLLNLIRLLRFGSVAKDDYQQPVLNYKAIA